MATFEIIPDATVTLFSAGVFRAAKVCVYDTFLCAQYGSGWIRLYEGGKTSTKMMYENLVLDFTPTVDVYRRLRKESTQ